MTTYVHPVLFILSSSIIGCATGQLEHRDDGAMCPRAGASFGTVRDIPGSAFLADDVIHVPMVDGFAFWGERLYDDADADRPLVVALSSWSRPSEDLNDWLQTYGNLALGRAGCSPGPAGWMIVGHVLDGPEIDASQSSGIQTEGKTVVEKEWGSGWVYRAEGILMTSASEMHVELEDEPEVGDRVIGSIDLVAPGGNIREIDFEVPMIESRMWAAVERPIWSQPGRAALD